MITWKQGVVYLKEELTTFEIVSQDVQHSNHLGEDENSVASLLQTHQQFVQQNQLPTASDQLLWRTKNLSETFKYNESNGNPLNIRRLSWKCSSFKNTIFFSFQAEVLPLSIWLEKDVCKV